MSKTIGEVIDALERAKTDVQVVFSFGYLVPTSVDSWRGIYAEAAIGYKYDGRYTDRPTVDALLGELRNAIDGREYSGWKGGEFRYNRDTPLHVDNPGEYSCTEITSIEIKDWQVTLHTAREE